MPFVVDFTRFDAASDAFLSGLISEGAETLKRHAGQTALEMALATPPGSLGVQGSAAHQRGRLSVLANVLRVVVPVSGVVGAEPVEAVVRRHWRRGRMSRPAKRVVVSRADLAAYLQKTYPKVGYTAGGFEAAAQALGASLPGWIEDRNGPGSVSVSVTDSRVEIQFSNDVPWLGDLNVAGRYAQIMKEAEAPLLGALAEVVALSARSAGF